MEKISENDHAKGKKKRQVHIFKSINLFKQNDNTFGIGLSLQTINYNKRYFGLSFRPKTQMKQNYKSAFEPYKCIGQFFILGSVCSQTLANYHFLHLKFAEQNWYFISYILIPIITNIVMHILNLKKVVYKLRNATREGKWVRTCIASS